MLLGSIFLCVFMAPSETAPPTPTSTAPAHTSGAGATTLATAPPGATPPAATQPSATVPAASLPAPQSTAAGGAASGAAPRDTATLRPQGPPIPTASDPAGERSAGTRPQATSPPASRPKPRGAFQVGDILIPALWLVAVLILAAFAFAILKRLRRVEEPGAEDQAHEQLAMFRALRDQGEMSEEEYRKVLHKLQPRIKGTGDKPESESGPGARPRT